MQIVINANGIVVQIALQKYFVVQDVLHEIRDIDMNMGAELLPRSQNFFGWKKSDFFRILQYQ